MVDMNTLRRECNDPRYTLAKADGHYESWFMRANHPTAPRGFWIRYTVFSPKTAPQNALGELWAILFDGDKAQHLAVKTELPISECTFSADPFRVAIGESWLTHDALDGAAWTNGHTIRWDLQIHGGSEPLFDLPPALYGKPLPKAKALVARPLARFAGTITVNDEPPWVIDDWVGSQNHNWGSKHTDEYAWGQVAGFDEAPETFLELATARLRFGPLWTPFMTPVVVRHEGKEFAMNALVTTMRRARYRYFDWRFAARTRGLRLNGHIHAPASAFVCLRYYNPPGGDKFCLNSKIASCTLTLKRRGRTQTLTSKHRAAFEILTDKMDHGLTPVV